MSILDNAFGKKPRVAKYKDLDPTKVVGESIKGNTANFGDIEKLGNLYSDEELAQLEKILPGYGESLSAGHALTDQIFGQASQELAGEIPQDVQDQIQRSSAYQALRGGYAGSGMSKALTARDLGLTSLDMIQKGGQLAGLGANTMQNWDTLARRDMLDPGSMFVSPGMSVDVGKFNKENSYAARQNQFNVDAAPDPGAKGVSDTLMAVIGAYLGGMGGGKGGGSSMGGQNGVSGYQSFNQGAQYQPSSYYNQDYGYSTDFNGWS